ncbi:lytic transglycosylase domain-containing protein [Gluconobacter sp. LMG 31484]|uniref:Lytic transglycosylase domain-containing protein n=1 Tax=Gluconobacter vitians TaxID=2728102 RepID=A0ABR9Y843_9PROT|nr:lytic transglycosylase domain-containing protein [Gluconobacter vitians]MBF0859936.1 lytic transglycosylase domain-containing protein [Gluconobacter vitians]
MPRPVFPTQSTARALSLIRAGAALGLIGLLAACASTNADMGSSSELPVSQEAANYRAHAKSYYAPPGPPEDPWGPYIQEASSRFDVPEAWIRAVMQQESGGHLFDHNGNFITSVPGAMGLLQLMPPTYDDMRQQYGLGEDPFDPHDNILAGTAYLRQMYDIYGSPGFLAAYNDGPGSLDRYLRRGRALPRETRRYVAAIGPHIAGITPHNRSAADLLVAQHDPNSQVMLAQNTQSADIAPITAPSERQAVSAAWSHREAAETSSDDSAEPDTSASTSTASTQAAPVQVASASAAAAPTSISAAWAARGYAPTPARPAVQEASVPADDVADSRVTAQEIPIGHHLQPQPIMAVMPATRPQYHMSLPATSSSSRSTAATGNWAIQVGAFANARQAGIATSAAHSKGGIMVASARSQVESVRNGRSNLYRARLTGLTHENAVAACRRLSHGSPCVVVPPGAH